jgi:hypothetical protein
MRRYPDFDEEVLAIAPEEELEDILHSIDCYRQQLNSRMQQLSRLFTYHPDLRSQYLAFLRTGGISAQDFEAFQEKKLRPRLIPQRGHLRLIHNKPAVRRVRLHKPEPDDAA